MTTDSDQEKEVKEVHDKYDNILQFINEKVQNEILPALKDKIVDKKVKLFVYILMLFVYIPMALKSHGWMGIIIVIITFFILDYLSNNYRNAKRDVSDDFEDKNAQINKTRISTKGRIILIILVVLLFYSPFFVGFHNYFVNPEITITSPRSGEVVKIDKDNTFLKISGNSKGLAGNQFLHLFILYRRTDSNKMPGEWNYDRYYMSDANPCTVYKDGSWECRIRLDEQYAEWVNGTLVIKSPNNPSNNISTNVDIVAIITKQSVGHSIHTKLETTGFRGKGSEYSWYKGPILFYSALLRKSTFHDEDYELAFENYFSCNLPKNLCDSHVTIRPLIDEYNYTEYYTNKLIINITPYNCIYRGDTITISVSSFQHLPIEGAEIYFDGKLINKKTSEDGTLFYTVNASGIYVIKATKNGFVNDTTSLEVKKPKAKFEFSNLSITPSKVESGEKVNISINKKFTVSIDVTNTGGDSGTYLAELKVSGSVVDSRNVTLDAGETEKIEFTTKIAEAGTTTIEIGTESGEITVTKTKSKTTLIAAVLIVLALLGAIGYVLISSAPEGGWTVEKLSEAIKDKFQRGGKGL